MEEFLKYIPSSLKEQSGSVFYSGRKAFKGKKKLYILGLNPGGCPINQKNQTIDWHNQSVLSKPVNWSEYKDESWLKHLPGEARLQRRVLHLLQTIGLLACDTPSSNICFIRSKREKNISKELNNLIDLCWPFHQNVIDKLGIKIVLCFGNTAGIAIKNKLNAIEKIDEFVENNNRKWKTKVYRNSLGQYVIIAPHPSIADWTNIRTDPSPLVKKYLSKMT